MPAVYVQLDVNYQDDDKVLEAGAFAELVYLRSLALAKRTLSDGVIRPAHLRRLTEGLTKLDGGRDDIDADELAIRLVRVGLWDEIGCGWRISAWTKHNITGDQVEARRSESGRRANHVRWRHAGVFDSCSVCDSDRSPVGVRFIPRERDRERDRETKNTRAGRRRFDARPQRRTNRRGSAALHAA